MTHDARRATQRCLVIFDVDHTLVRVRWPSGHGFVQALSDVTGVRDVSWDWGSYRWSSDNGIVDEIFARHAGRAPRPDEIAAMQARFLEILHANAAADPEFVVAVPGARAFVDALAADADWAVALATGNWRVAAHAKLRLAGFGALLDAGVVGGYADDAWGRSAIIAAARDRALAAHGPHDHVAFVGDAVWDVRAARAIGMPFCGVAGTGRREALHRAGARAIIADFTDAAAARQALLAAVPPEPGDEGGRRPDAD